MTESFQPAEPTQAEAEHVLGLLGFGLVPARLRHDETAALDALRRLLSGSDRGVLHWSLGHERIPSAEVLAGFAEAVRCELSCEARIALHGERHGADPVMALHTFTETGRYWGGIPASVTFFASSRSAVAPRAMRRVPRLGFFPGTTGEHIALVAAGLALGCDMRWEMVKLSRRQPSCDVLVWADLDARHASAHVDAAARAIGGVGAGACAAFVPDEHLTARSLSRLRRAAGAGAVALMPAHDVEPHIALARLLSALADDVPLDYAAGFGLLFADERMVRRDMDDHGRMRAREWLLLERHRWNLEPEPAAHAGPMPELTGHEWESLRDRPVPSPPPDPWPSPSDRSPIMPDFAIEPDSAIEPPRQARAFRLAKPPVLDDLPEPRYLQAGFHDPAERDTPLRGPLARDHAYEVAVHVGEPLPENVVLDAALPALPRPEETHRLKIVFWEPEVAPKPLVRHIDLPPDGDSPECRFRIRTPDRDCALGARVTVLHRNRVLQTGVLTVPVGRSEEPASFTVDAAPRAVLAGLDRRTKFDAALVVNEAGGRRVVHATTPAGAQAFDLSEGTLAAFVDFVAGRLGRIAREPERYAGLDSPATHELLRDLAQQGGDARDYLDRHALRRPLGDVEYVQVVSARAGEVFPAEYLYALAPPDDDAVLCPNAAEALSADPATLEGGWCAGCDPRAEEDSRVCPLAFWGLRCVIERRAHTPEDRDIDGDFAFLTEPFGEDTVLEPLSQVILGTSSRVTSADVEALTARLHAAVGEGRMRVAEEGWEQWKDYVATAPAATMLALLPHQETAAGVPCLEIAGTKLKASAVKAKVVRPAEDGPFPLALLLGCETAHGASDYEQFTLKFQDHGAALVVSTMSSVLGRHAGPALAEIVEAIERCDDPRPFPEVMREVRRRLLVGGTPMVLSLVSFGDADWEVVGSA